MFLSDGTMKADRKGDGKFEWEGNYGFEPGAIPKLVIIDILSDCEGKGIYNMQRSGDYLKLTPEFEPCVFRGTLLSDGVFYRDRW